VVELPDQGDYQDVQAGAPCYGRTLDFLSTHAPGSRCFLGSGRREGWRQVASRDNLHSLQAEPLRHDLQLKR